MACPLPFATFALQQEPFVVRITINHEQGDEKDFQDIIAAFLKIFEFQKNVAIIIDASSLKAINKQNLKNVRHCIRNNRPIFENYLKCSTIVIRSVIIKNVINTLFKIQPPVRPNKIVNSVEEAERFISAY
jgi:hypothetical protein